MCGNDFWCELSPSQSSRVLLNLLYFWWESALIAVHSSLKVLLSLKTGESGISHALWGDSQSHSSSESSHAHCARERDRGNTSRAGPAPAGAEQQTFAHGDLHVHLHSRRPLVSWTYPWMSLLHSLFRAENFVLFYFGAPDSVLDFHPDHKNVLLVSPCSGHGFKVAFQFTVFFVRSHFANSVSRGGCESSQSLIICT